MASVGSVLQMVQQNDEKHEEGHGRLRADYRSLESRVTSLERCEADTRVKLATMDVKKERRRELSQHKTVVIAALIGGGIRLVEVLVNATLKVLGH